MSSHFYEALQNRACELRYLNCQICSEDFDYPPRKLFFGDDDSYVIGYGCGHWVSLDV